MQNLLQVLDSCTTMESRKCIQTVIMNRKEELVLEKHNSKIWKGKDDIWYTYVVPKETNNRKLLKRRSKEEVIELLYDFYYPPAKIYTIRDLYPEWLRHKSCLTKRSTTIYRIDKDWIKYYLNDSFSKEYLDCDITKLKAIDLLEWMCYLIKKYDMTKTKYYNVSIVVRGIYQYALAKNYIDDNTFVSVVIPKHLLVKKRTPESETQVFTVEEESLLIHQAINNYFNKREHNVFLFIVPLVFLTGLRLGEVLALEWDDITKDGCLLQIHQSMVKDMESRKNGSWETATYSIQNYLKKNAEERFVPLTPNAQDVLDLIREHYTNNAETPTYIFEKDGRLANPSSIQNTWKYLCDQLHIERRSPHKGRKTYISKLIDNKIDIRTICKIAGHNDEKTTLKHYAFSRRNQQELNIKLIQALDANTTIKHI